MGVPESSLPAAEGYAKHSGIPYGQGLVKNRYIGRTFIAPDQASRDLGVRRKFNPLHDNVRGKRLIVVEDSIVRGTTHKAVVRMLREAGAAEIHLRVTLPPWKWPCVYGIDFPDPEKLIANQHTLDEIRDYLGADSIGYLDVPGMVRATGQSENKFCLACFNGKYPVPVDPNVVDVEQVRYPSKDGTDVTMFLVHKRGLARDGRNAAVIHGYGGFGVSLLPKFTAHVIPFLESGGIYVVVNARGGGEFGEEWHRAGMRANKQNVFDDFIAAGEWLIGEGYTQASRLGCFGWSNGGLSVNAVAVQRPDLWKAVVAGAAATDMARFHTAHGGQHWVADYGSPEDSDDLNFLMQYSPYHTLPKKIAAPAILTVAPDNDDRVAPWHSYKMHAAWLAANLSENPILLRREEKAGHRGSPSASRTSARYADIWTFFFWQFGIE